MPPNCERRDDDDATLHFHLATYKRMPDATRVGDRRRQRVLGPRRTRAGDAVLRLDAPPPVRVAAPQTPVVWDDGDDGTIATTTTMTTTTTTSDAALSARRRRPGALAHPVDMRRRERCS